MKLNTESLCRLQESVLRAVLSRTPLEGRTEILHFPDLDAVLGEPEALVSATNLAGPLKLDLPMRILDDAALSEFARERDHFPYLCFAPAECDGERVRLVLELRIAFSDLDALRLGIVSVTAERGIGEKWRVVDTPTARAY